jgi:methionine-rich copper-binding protein CopC
MVYHTDLIRLHVLLQKIACLVGASLLLLVVLVIPAGKKASAVATSVTLTNYGASQPTGITFEYTLSVAVSGGRNILYVSAPAGFVLTPLTGAQLASATTVYLNDVQQTVSTFLSPCCMWSSGIQYWLGSGITVAAGATLKFVIPSGYITNPSSAGIKTWAFRTAEGSGAAIESFSATTTIGAAPDTTAPTLSSSNPADNATGVGLSSNIALTFSETVTAVAGKNIVIKKSDGATVETISATSAQVTFSGSTATVNPASNFDYLTGYYVLIDAGAFVDAAANGYAGISSTTALNFVSAADVTAPTLSSSTPADNATGVATASNISLVFSENVTAVSGKNIVIKKSDDTTVETISVTDGGQVSVSGSTVVINPTAAFIYSGSYYVLVDAGAFRDNASNSFAGMSSSTALNFSVVADTATTSTSTTTIPSSTSSTIAAGTTTTTVVVAAVTAPTSTTPATASLTAAGGVTTTTVSISVTKPSAPTTTAPRSVLSLNASSAVTSTTTSSTSTSTTLPPAVAPPAPAATPGTSTAVIGGKKVQMSVVRGNNSLEISSASIQMKLQVVDESGSTVALDADGNAVLSQGSLVKYSIAGAEPGADLEAWLFSEPFKLGTVIVGEDGRVSGLLPINSEVPAGDHRLVFKTRTATGDDATVSVGVIVGEIGGGVSIGSIIFGTLFAAVLAGLVIPATRRRRQTRELGRTSLT